ncbi:MAG: arsenite efflux transporter metallochaperone ArsD [Armatimonadetes bacterium]|nr:arsenite efflux transporter metallochaperone ArsD [Armatimonadota bacterium]
MPAKVEIFEPQACCPGGICGDKVDMTLVEVYETAMKIARETGAQVLRYDIKRDFKRFKNNPAIWQAINSEGADILPLTLVDGEVVKRGGYPTYEELKAALSGAAAAP